MCIFCNPVIREQGVIAENDLAFVIYDKFPQSRGHCLVIPKRHSDNIFGLTAEEATAIFELLSRAKSYLDAKYSPNGYNILNNCGADAGQVVFHTHIHLIPRYPNDKLEVLA